MVEANHDQNSTSDEDITQILGITIIKQLHASNPQNSAWVSANAGSGKTYVLAQRVVRLLLKGVAPSKILCLTFTKAASAEMANRVYKQLGSWSSMDDNALRAELEKTGEKNPNAAKLRMSRMLFTRALESPGGLKIQTIHAFCEALLHQFTLEANISGHFEVMDDQQQIAALTHAHQSMLAATHSQPNLAHALAQAMKFGSDQTIESGLQAVIKNRQKFSNWIRTYDDSPQQAITALAKTQDINLDESYENFASRCLEQLPISDKHLKEFGLAAANYTTSECQRLALTIAQYHTGQNPIEKLHNRFAIYLKKDGDFRKAVGTKPYNKDVAGAELLFAEEMEHLKHVRDLVKNRAMLQGSLGLFILADNVLSSYNKRKRANGLLDYDDLVNRTADLLARSDVRQWVHYKLDAGIDHILVDEAQDTSPSQWEIINAISEEFFAGQSARETQRTIFAVGDQKQSIYSFQGAEPEMFDLQKNLIKRKAKNTQLAFEDVNLDISFRSTRDVLSAVDRVFANPDFVRGLQNPDADFIHEPNRQGDPGEVIVWPMIKSPAKEKQQDWRLPVDHISEQHPSIQLARQIAATIAQWVEDEEILPGKGRKITHGDILILVRKRDRFASAITRELKQAGLSVAGADRLSLVSHIAIEDLLSLGKWTLFPNDDLSLAEVLKSPLFNLDEDGLFSISVDRGKNSLWQSLQQQKNNDDTLSEITRRLQKLQILGRTCPPYEFYNDILSVQSGRKKFKARLGDEVDDVLDAFLLEALKHTTNGGSGLQEFIHTLETASPDIKREVDLQRDEIRVMTVHSAKGLEAPIVFLVDPGSPPYSAVFRPIVFKIEEPSAPTAFLWQPATGDATKLSEDINHNIAQKAEEEYRRLLYVAMTRAEDKLIVCGYSGKYTPKSPTWHHMVHDSLAADCELLDDGGAMRWTAKHPLRKNVPMLPEKPETSIKREKLPAWISTPPPTEFNAIPPLSPSIATASIEARLHHHDQTLEIDHAGNFALQRGNITHQLLQVLPQITPDKRQGYTTQYMEKMGAQWHDKQRQALSGEVMAILNNAKFAEIFSANSIAELSVTGIIDPGGLNKRVSGQIDRIAISDERVLIVDYKTDRNIPNNASEVSDQYLVQLAIYQQLITKIYPTLPVQCVLLWSSGPQMMEINDGLLSQKYTQWLKFSKRNLEAPGHSVA